MMTSSEAYQIHQDGIASQLSYIQALLAKHAEEGFYGWERAGDLAHVKEELAEVIRFLGGNPNAPAAGKLWTKASTVPTSE